MEEKSFFFALLDKYLKGEATSSEQELVEEYYSRLEQRNDAKFSETRELELKEIISRNISKEMKDSIATKYGFRYNFGRWRSYAAAAAIVSIFTLTMFYNPEKTRNNKGASLANVQVDSVRKDDLAPGGNKATLFLADGSKLSLDDARLGQIAKQGNVSISKVKQGQLVYVPIPNHDEKVAGGLFNKIETPKGGQYQINLPDGSKVWLNAESSLKFPAFFNGNERLVELKGEAYFEVAPNKLMPFKIHTKGQNVEVLGTRFNINGYSNESNTKTTLVEGSVKIANTSTNEVKYLKPGQQAIISEDGPMQLITVNADETTAWKGGRFVFNDMELESIMHQLERWYDVEVDYAKIPKIKYNVHISMGLNLSKVLEILEVTGDVKFKIVGRKIKILEAKK